MATTLSTRALAELVPDEPRWIDLRGLLLSGRCDAWAEPRPGDGFAAASRDYPFAALFGRPRPELIGAAVAHGLAAFAHRPTAEEWQLIAAPEHRGLVEAALPEWRRQGIMLHRWPGDLEWPGGPLESETRLLPDGHRRAGLDLERVPEASRWELDLDWVAGRPMAVALAEERPVAFCYAAFTTERFWDVSIETLGPYRRRGLAAACFAVLARHMARRGKTPTWGAMLDNPASLGLAAKLGFVPDARLDAWSR